jgi:SAM-dependent methyltransferase
MATAAPYVRSQFLLRVRSVWSSVRGALARRSRAIFLPRQARHPFDRKHGVDTGGLIYADGLVTGHEHDRQSAGYYATAPSLFHGAMAGWNATLARSEFGLSDYTFVDIGCGKGRVVMLASEYAFREVAGVELNPRLVAVARRNVRRWMRWPRTCRNVRIVRDDTLSIPIPDGPVVLYFFNSFERGLVELLLARLVEAAATRAAPIDVIYVHPEHGGLFAETRTMELLADEAIAFSAEDAAADVFGVGFDCFAIYRLPGCLSAEMVPYG